MGMLDRLFEYLIFKKICILIPTKETFFKKVDLKVDVHLTKETILLNFSSFAPYKEPDVVFLRRGESLLLWFFQKNTVKFSLPEGLLLFLTFEKELDALYIFENSPSLIVALKHHIVSMMLHKERISPTDIEFLKREYTLSDVKYLNALAYTSRVRQGIKALSIRDIASFLNFKFDREKIANAFLDTVALPAFVVVLSLVTLQYGANILLTQKIEQVQVTYDHLRAQNEPLKTKLEQTKKIVAKWETFQRDNENALHILKLAQTLAASVQDANATLISLKLSSGHFEIATLTQDSINLFEKINASTHVKNVKLLSSNKQKNDENTLFRIGGNYDKGSR